MPGVDIAASPVDQDSMVIRDMALCAEAGLQSISPGANMVAAAPQATRQSLKLRVTPVAVHLVTVALSTLTTHIERPWSCI